jgi:phosphoserine/homoserine phosphotransferase
MQIVCLDLEGVLVPEIWIAFAERTGIPEFRRTTRDEPDYDKLMRWRLDLLRRHGLKLADIQAVIAGMAPMDGARTSSTTCARATRSSSCRTPSTSSPTR